MTDFVDVEEAKKEYVAGENRSSRPSKRPTKRLLREMLYQMVLGRRFEEKCSEVYGWARWRILPSVYRTGSYLRGLDDAAAAGRYVITAYRDHVQAMIKGMTPESVMAELYGKIGAV